MRLLIAGAALALAGCASQPQQVYAPRDLSPAEAQQMPTAQLCLGVSTFRPSNANVAQWELDRRGVNCQDHAQAVSNLQQQQAQERAQAMGILLQNMNRPATTYQPYQIPPPPGTGPQTNCTTRYVGGAWRTVCN